MMTNAQSTPTATIGTPIVLDNLGGRKAGTVIAEVPVKLVAFTASGRAMVPARVEYRVKFEDGSEMVSDLRQRCWTVG